MTTPAIDPARLALLDQFTLARGAHADMSEGACSMEFVSYLAGEGFTDAPECASPVIQRYVIRLNDRWDLDKRQTLKPYLVRMIGTGDDGKDAARERIASDHMTNLMVPWLELAGIPAEDVPKAIGEMDLESALRAVRRAASAKSDESRAVLRNKIRATLLDQGKTADATAAADAAADAAAATVAATVAAGAASWDESYSRVYGAVGDRLRENPLPIFERISELAAEQDNTALDLLDKLITAEES